MSATQADRLIFDNGEFNPIYYYMINATACEDILTTSAFPETLDVDEFLYDVSLHLRRKDIRTLLSYLGMPVQEIEELLSEQNRYAR